MVAHEVQDVAQKHSRDKRALDQVPSAAGGTADVCRHNQCQEELWACCLAHEAVVPFSLWQQRLLYAWKFGSTYVFGMQRPACAR